MNGPSRITGRQWLIVVTVQSVTLLFGVTLTSVTVILPQMKGALSATQDQISWVLTLNLVATAVATPLTGWLAERWASATCCSLPARLHRRIGALRFRRFAGNPDRHPRRAGRLRSPLFPLGQAILLGNFNREQQPFVVMMWGVGRRLRTDIGTHLRRNRRRVAGLALDLFLILPLGLAACIPSCSQSATRNAARRGTSTPPVSS